MLKSQINPIGVENIDEISPSFIRLPYAVTATVFQGWGPRI